MTAAEVPRTKPTPVSCCVFHITSLGGPVNSGKQKSQPSLSPQQIHSDERCLAASFIGMAGALPSRPRPRHQWDNIASGRAHYKGRDAVLAAQDAMRDAIASGDRVTIEETAERISSHFDRMKLVALRAYYAIVSGHVTLSAARAKAAKETSEAMCHMVLSAAGEIDPDRLVAEITEAIEALVDYRARLVSPVPALNDPNRPRLVRA